ncbi:permease for cytosine/purines, uracil, thiamine, allantoin-domain-containing protein [Pisolithus croceorrhizus]|nr:permease for cytosine/purines, uracil, thiamine, allantoin-domain-containing protein [Pisolithus croceorrhizus]KAI6135332.1 permease for cytosine/purines, uracil, thiamine, allantoin-domain-containing protein [Pisolithus croceorrhizus]KAI6160354.1 permease for cytosine/purines, uracil, thiamine, allantoin-domain-containing protein [Pisolithus thermaeus]
MAIECTAPLDFLRPSTWALEPEETTFANYGWSNKDMDPVPPRLRTWTGWNYVTYWVSDATNVAIWELAGSMLAIGLSWRQALSCIAAGYAVISVVMVMTGTIGARLHVAFPVLNRSSFGFWFSYFTVFSRVILAMFWFGIQTYSGSQAVYQMLKAIWPSIARLPNHLPASANITSSGLLCYLLYWIIQSPFLLLSPHRIRWLFLVKGIIVPITWLAMVIWAFVRVPPSTGLFAQHATISGSQLSWTWLSAMNSALGIYATLSVNIPDFTRYARNEQAQFIQPLVIPIVFTLCSFAGIAVTSAGIQLYGEVLWDPLLLIDRWDNRAAAFFASLAFVIATIGTNISANSLSAGNDMTVLLPKYINIRRGQIICAIIGGWALCPWEILASAQGFLSFMNGYTIFLGPFAGIMITDFWLLHKGHVDVPAMYDPHGRYRYTYGFNWRAVLSILVTVGPTMPGLINSINPAVRIGNATRLFDIAWMYGFVVASVVYYVTSVVFPARETYVEKLISADDPSAPMGAPYSGGGTSPVASTASAKDAEKIRDVQVVAKTE